MKNKALIVDDVENNRDILSRVLLREGYETVLFKTGLEVVTYCKRHSMADVSCVMMDIKMPEMDGIEAAKTLRSMGYKGAIIAITANALTANSHPLFFDIVIRKPLTLNKLRKITFDTIQRKEQLGIANHDEPDPSESENISISTVGVGY